MPPRLRMPSGAMSSSHTSTCDATEVRTRARPKENYHKDLTARISQSKKLETKRSEVMARLGNSEVNALPSSTTRARRRTTTRGEAKVAGRHTLQGVLEKRHDTHIIDYRWISGKLTSAEYDISSKTHAPETDRAPMMARFITSTAAGRWGRPVRKG